MGQYRKRGGVFLQRAGAADGKKDKRKAGGLPVRPDPEKDAADRYSRQGEGQPFGYIEYRYDAVGETYFAQAREYKAEVGRFTAEDVVRGNNALTQTLNRYVYCWNKR